MPINKEKILLVKRLLRIRSIGVVKWYNSTMGLGVINCLNQNKELLFFFKNNKIKSDLNQGEKVEFDIGDSESGQEIGKNLKPLK